MMHSSEELERRVPIMLKNVMLQLQGCFFG